MPPRRPCRDVNRRTAPARSNKTLQQVPTGSPCRSRSGAVAGTYHTGRFTRVPRLAKLLRVQAQAYPEAIEAAHADFATLTRPA